MPDAGAPVTQWAASEVAVIEGNTFAVSNALGDFVADAPSGFFCADTRFLSGYQLTLDGDPPALLSSGNVGHNAASFYGVNRGGAVPAETISIIRDRYVGTGLHDDITLINHGDQAVQVELQLALAADFADVFEVRGALGGGKALVKLGQISVEAVPGCALAIVYRREAFVRQTLVRCSHPAHVNGARLRFPVSLAPKERWQVCVEVSPVIDKRPAPMPCRAPQFGAALILRPSPDDAEPTEGLVDDRWLRSVPRLQTSDVALQLAYDRAVADLNALRLVETGYQVPAAGLPWFMAIFGRDSLITGYQTLLLGPDLAKGALRVLASYQAQRTDEFRDEQPGKMPHEIRRGELSSLGEVPHSRYYGTVDATPLFLILLSETYRWTGDVALVRELLPNAQKALAWIDRYGDCDGDGFVEYQQRSARGLRNQCWKDSGDSMRMRDGSIAEGPIAVVEVQGYVYDAKLRLAELYDALGSPSEALALRSQAAALKQAFNSAFWMPDEGFFALALDGQKRQVDSVTSNPGHCLWSGIVDEDKAPLVAERLLAEDLFAGWGVRTMSTYMNAYHPISYHNGSIWPHDNSLIVAGLLRYGFRAEAKRIIDGLLAASRLGPANRLPELFAGYRRRQNGFPVSYPGANAPQAWAAGTVTLILQALLGVSVHDGVLAGQPLPGAPRLTLTGVPLHGRRVDLALAHQDGRAVLWAADSKEPVAPHR